ncbi:MAG: acetyl-CoA C-acyltransferase, partial [Candidatus Heimdallarchaeota archaeon]
DDLLGFVLKEILKRNPSVNPLDIEDAIIGCVTQTGEQGMNIARLGVLNANLPVELPGTSVNRMCGSGIQANNFAAQGIISNVHDLVFAGGVETMTRVPIMSDGAEPSDNITRNHHIVSQGISAELIAERWGITREDLDTLSLESHSRSVKAAKAGYFDKQMVHVPIPNENGTDYLKFDEGVRPGTSLEKLAKLKPAFKQPDGLVTAGNSSQLSDGASVSLLSSLEKADELGIKPRAKFVNMALAGVDPTIMLTAPMPATEKALKKANLTLDDIDVIEINEAFASVPLAFIKDLKPDLNKLNPNGGAIAHGHPLGATGSVLLAKTLYELERTGGTYGLITMCIGFGQGIATIIERIK